MANNVMYESYCEFCSGESSVNWFPDFFRWRNGESSGQSGSASFHHVHVSLSWYIWYTKMKFAATKLITSKSQTKSKTIPNQELSIFHLNSVEKKDAQKHQNPDRPNKNLPGQFTWRLGSSKKQMCFGPKLSPGEIFTSPKKNTTKTKVTCSYEHRFCPKRLRRSNKNTPPTRSPRLMSYVNSTNDPRIALHLGLFRGATGGGRLWGRMEV